MAQRVAERMAHEARLDAKFTSAATSADELGHPMDRRAGQALQTRGYRTAQHRAHRISADEIRQADLVVAMEQIHIDKMRQLVPDANNLVLITDFDPSAQPGSGIDDPWWGAASGFDATLDELERAIPGLLAWIRDRTEQSQS